MPYFEKKANGEIVGLRINRLEVLFSSTSGTEYFYLALPPVENGTA
jgi:hypothetical protein